MKDYFSACAFLVFMLPALSYAQDNQVIIKDHIFTPSTLTVSAGTTVTWTNRDEDPHTVADTSSKHAFHSAALDTNESYSYTFTTPGEFKYFCTMHPMMVGNIIVTAGK